MAVYVSVRQRLRFLLLLAFNLSAGIYLFYFVFPSVIEMINFTQIASAAFHMPKVGLGTLGIAPSEAKPVINEALSLGYRLFDCAPVYFNEQEIGDAFHEATTGVPRTDVFITSKLASPFHRPEHVEPALRKTLNGAYQNIMTCEDER
jgi:aryl-alcohol dehydrogenase-like predicted oxidoreductase